MPEMTNQVHAIEPTCKELDCSKSPGLDISFVLVIILDFKWTPPVFKEWMKLFIFEEVTVWIKEWAYFFKQGDWDCWQWAHSFFIFRYSTDWASVPHTFDSNLWNYLHNLSLSQRCQRWQSSPIRIQQQNRNLCWQIQRQLAATRLVLSAEVHLLRTGLTCLCV